MNTLVKDVVDPAVITLVTAFVAYLLKVGLPALIDYLLQSKANKLVFAAEDLIKGSGQGSAKLQDVLDKLDKYAKSLLLYWIKDARLQAYAAAAVTKLHAELPESLGAAEKQIEEAKNMEIYQEAAQTEGPVTNAQDQPASPEQETTATLEQK
jgi:hypothetical protein